MYNILKNNSSVIQKHKTLKSARLALADMLKVYKINLKRNNHKNSICSWHGKDCIYVFDTTNDGRINGDLITYNILEG